MSVAKTLCQSYCIFLHTDTIKREGIAEVFVLCTRGELRKFRVPDLIPALEEHDLTVHHHPFPDGMSPSMEEGMKLLDELKTNLKQGRKSLVQ